MLTIASQAEEIAENFKNWMITNQSNPLLWVGLFFGGIVIYLFTYGRLNKTK